MSSAIQNQLIFWKPADSSKFLFTRPMGTINDPHPELAPGAQGRSTGEPTPAPS
jgi:hypothetical protein